jgi:hypothetical protein
MSPSRPPRPRVAAARAPVACALLVVHPVLVYAFTMWAIDGVLHCDDEGVQCGLGFAPQLLLPTVVGVMVAVVMVTIGVLVRPDRCLHAWLVLLIPTALSWLVVWPALAMTV